jgi:hypothetical protein
VQRVTARAPLHRSPSERALAWLYTGPLGQLWGTAADVAVLWVRWMIAKRRGELDAGDAA